MQVVEVIKKSPESSPFQAGRTLPTSMSMNQLPGDGPNTTSLRSQNLGLVGTSTFLYSTR